MKSRTSTLCLKYHSFKEAQHDGTSNGDSAESADTSYSVEFHSSADTMVLGTVSKGTATTESGLVIDGVWKFLAAPAHAAFLPALEATSFTRLRGQIELAVFERIRAAFRAEAPEEEGDFNADYTPER